MVSSDRTTTGVSLIEMLVVIGIVVLLTRFAIFDAGDWIKRQNADATMLALRSAINTARHAAVTLNHRVVVCPAAGEQCGRRDRWADGMLIFADLNRNRRRDADEPRVAALPGFDHGSVSWRSFRNRSYLVFTPRGLTDWQNGHFRYCPANGDLRWARQLVLNAAGRMYGSRDSDQDGIHEDAQGAPLVCR